MRNCLAKEIKKNNHRMKSGCGVVWERVALGRAQGIDLDTADYPRMPVTTESRRKDETYNIMEASYPGSQLM